MRLPMVKSSKAVLAVCLLAATVLSGCAGGSPDPVSAVVDQIRRTEQATTNVYATVALGNAYLVLHSFQKGSDCYLGEALVVQRGGTWHTSSSRYGGGSCAGVTGGPNQAITTGGGGSGSSDGHTWSVAQGYVHDPNVNRVDVVWDDGVVTSAVLTSGFYYSVRDGVRALPTSAQAYDQNDQPLPSP